MSNGAILANPGIANPGMEIITGVTKVIVKEFDEGKPGVNILLFGIFIITCLIIVTWNQQSEIIRALIIIIGAAVLLIFYMQAQKMFSRERLEIIKIHEAAFDDYKKKRNREENIV